MTKARHRRRKPRSEEQVADAALTLLKKKLPTDKLKKLAEAEAWYRGDLSHLLLPGAQRAAYDMVHQYHHNHPDDSGPCMLHLHRGAGKSWLLCILGMERCLQHPEQIVRIGSPMERQTLEITDPAIRMLLSKCPPDLKPKKRDNTWTFKNPRWENPDAVSQLVLFGARENADGQRGLRSNMILFDEVRDLADPEYVIAHVLGPHFVMRDFPLFILSSTSPATTGHYWWQLVDEAQTEKRYLHIDVDHNPALRPQDERMLVKLCGGRDTVAWKREALCLRVADDTLLAVPSFSRKKEQIVQEWERPEYFYPYVAADIGFRDASAILWFYIDYMRQKLVYEDELVVTSTGTFQLIERAKQIEERCFGQSKLYDRILRWGDATPRELEDFRLLEYPMMPAKSGEGKWDKWAGLGRLEALCAQEKIIINPRCRSLTYQLENAVRNKFRTDLQKELPSRDPNAPVMGHQDAIWAAAYGAWQVRHRWLESPAPAAPGAAWDQVDPAMLTRRGLGGQVSRNPLKITRNRVV